VRFGVSGNTVECRSIFVNAGLCFLCPQVDSLAGYD